MFTFRVKFIYIFKFFYPLFFILFSYLGWKNPIESPKLTFLFYSLNFFYWVPFFLFYFESSINIRVKKILLFFSFLSINFLIDYFLPKSSYFLWIVINFILTILQFLVLLFSLKFKTKFLKIWSFIFGWITLEIILDTIFSLPLFNLGYRLALKPEFIQFYEIIGVYGGSFFILILNSLIYIIISEKFKLMKKNIFLLLFFISSIIFLNIYSTYSKKNFYISNKINVLIFHTFLNSYNERYSKSQNELNEIYNKELIKNNLDSIDLIIMPETSITDMGWLKYYNYYKQFKFRFESIFKKNNKIKILGGGKIYSNVDTPNTYEKLLNRSIFSESYKTWYKVHNVAFLLDSNSNVQLHNKKILVPFEEYNPIPFLPNFIKISLSYSNFSKDIYNDKTIFNLDTLVSILPIICYESFVENYISSLDFDFGFIALILNEGWFEYNSIPNLFYSFSVVRAIEHNKYLVRSSNYGISSVINNEGKTLIEFNKNKFGSIIYKIPLIYSKTVYSKINLFIKLVIIFVYIILIFLGFINGRFK